MRLYLCVRTASAVNELTLEVARLRRQWADSQIDSRLVRSSLFRCPLPCYLTFYRLARFCVCTDEENFIFHVNRNPTVHNASNTCLGARQHTHTHTRTHNTHRHTLTHTHTCMQTHTQKIEAEIQRNSERTSERVKSLADALDDALSEHQPRHARPQTVVSTGLGERVAREGRRLLWVHAWDRSACVLEPMDVARLQRNLRLTSASASG